jgi:hypothetical protein
LTENLMGFEDESLARAERYCNDYCEGFNYGDRLSVTDVGSDASEGFKRGFEAGRSSQKTPDKSEWDSLKLEFETLSHGGSGDKLDGNDLDRWNWLNNEFNRRGNKSWEDWLLELFRHLQLYGRLTMRSEEELSAQQVLTRGVIKRFAKTLSA